MNGKIVIVSSYTPAYTWKPNRKQQFYRKKASKMSYIYFVKVSGFYTIFRLDRGGSSYAIGAVLSEDEKPITMIPRKLTSAEENYATNEPEILASAKALKMLETTFTI